MPLDNYYFFLFVISLHRPRIVTTTKILKHKVIFGTQNSVFLNTDFAYKLQTLHLPYLVQQCDSSYHNTIAKIITITSNNVIVTTLKAGRPSYVVRMEDVRNTYRILVWEPPVK